MIQKVQLGMYSAKSGREEFYTRNPGMGHYRSCNPEFVWPIPGLLGGTELAG
jgi:hypothetical protein